jgi:hypothetical protein
VKALLFAAIAVDLLASLYLLMIAPILVYGWNNTSFNAGWAAAVAVLLVIGIGGPIAALRWRNTKPREALLAAGIPALLVVAGCVWATLD